MFLAVWGLSGCVTGGQEGRPQDPERARALAKVRTELAADYYERKEYRQAREELDKAIRADSRYAPAYDVRALLHLALLEDAEAESDFKRSLDLDPKNPETRIDYGWFLCQHGRERDGLKYFLSVANDPLYTSPGKAYLNAGICAKKMGLLQDAELYLQRAIIIQADFPVALVEMADVAFTIGDVPRAKSYFARFEKASKGQLAPEHLFLAVRIERKLGDRSAADGYAARLRKEYPDSRESVMLRQLQ
jgi:type IV pilus assembly protein PilF